jgi:hypothetical protein
VQVTATVGSAKDGPVSPVHSGGLYRGCIGARRATDCGADREWVRIIVRTLDAERVHEPIVTRPEFGHVCRTLGPASAPPPREFLGRRNAARTGHEEARERPAATRNARGSVKARLRVELLRDQSLVARGSGPTVVRVLNAGEP